MEQSLVDVLRRMETIERRLETSEQRFSEMDKRGQHNAELLVRIDERTARQERDTAKYVTREEFAPIKGLVYGLVGLLLTGVIGAVLALVIRK